MIVLLLKKLFIEVYMTKAMLDKFLLQSIPRAILLYGDNEFLISYYANIILKKLNNDYQRMYFEEYNHQEVLNYLGANSLFGGTNIIVLKLYNTLNKKQIQDIFYVLAHNPNSFFIVELLKSPTITDSEYAKRFKAMAALFKPTPDLQDVLEVRFYQPTREDMLKILYARASELGLQMDASLLNFLLDVQHNDLSIAHNELNKFIYFETITFQLIEELSYNLGDVKLETLLNCLFDKKGHLISILQILHDEGMDNMELLREIGRYFYILFKLYGHSKTHGNIDSKEALGYKAPPQIFNTWSRRSLKLTTEKYLLIFDIMNKWRVQQLRGKNVAMQYLIAIQQIL